VIDIVEESKNVTMDRCRSRCAAWGIGSGESLASVSHIGHELASVLLKHMIILVPLTLFQLLIIVCTGKLLVRRACTANYW